MVLIVSTRLIRLAYSFKIGRNFTSVKFHSPVLGMFIFCSLSVLNFLGSDIKEIFVFIYANFFSFTLFSEAFKEQVNILILNQLKLPIFYPGKMRKIR